MIHKGVPQGMHTLTPHITVRGANKAIQFYEDAFGAEELMRHAMPDGRIVHADLKIGDSHLMLNDEFPEMGGCSAPPPAAIPPYAIQLYVEDVDETFHRAVRAGARVTMPVSDMFWGDRYGQLVDPFGYRWAIATRKEELTPDEMRRRSEEFFNAAAR